MAELLDAYFAALSGLIRDTEVTDDSAKPIELREGLDRMWDAASDAHESGNKIMFIGNGGSAGIASHLAIDFSKNGGLRSQVFNDAAALTCLSNDLGYENVFAKQVDLHAREGDVLVAISSSGQSPNILRAVDAARSRKCRIASFSGFSEDNQLRRRGDVNFYVRSDQYGFVETAHLVLCHSILDLQMGWKPSS